MSNDPGNELLVRFGERNDLGDAISTKIPGIRGGQAVRGKGTLKKVLEEKELDIYLLNESAV